MSGSKSTIRCYRVLNDEFNKNHELQFLVQNEGTVFQQFEFLKAFGEEVEFIIATKNDKICGVLPLVTTQKMGFKAYHRPPYAHIYGPLIGKTFINESDVIISELLKNIDKFSLAEFKLPIQNQDILPYVNAGGTVLASQTHIISIDSNYSSDSVHSSKKRYLKKLSLELEKGNLKLYEGSDYNDQILSLQTQVAKNNNFRPYVSTLEKIMANLGEEQAYSLLITTADGQPIAGAFCPFDKYSAYHLINASIKHPDTLLNKTNILSTYLAISKAMSKGLSFDFEGSNIPGVASFYRMMGGQPKIHYRIQMPKTFLGRAYFLARQL